MEREAGCIFHIYRLDRFLEYAEGKFDIEVQEKTINEIKSIQVEEELRQTEEQEQLDLEHQKTIESRRPPMTSMLGHSHTYPSEIQTLPPGVPIIVDQSMIEGLMNARRLQEDLRKGWEDLRKGWEESQRQLRQRR